MYCNIVTKPKKQSQYISSYNIYISQKKKDLVCVSTPFSIEISVNSQIKNFPQQQKKKHQEFILARTIPIHTYLSQPTKHVRRTQTNPTLPILTCSLHNIHRNVSSNTSSFITFLISSCVIFNFFKSDLHEINIFLLSKQNI